MTISTQQREIDRLLKRPPLLKARADDILRHVYPDAVKAAALETGQAAGEDQAPIPSVPTLNMKDVMNFHIEMSWDGGNMALSNWPL